MSSWTCFSPLVSSSTSWLCLVPFKSLMSMWSKSSSSLTTWLCFSFWRDDGHFSGSSKGALKDSRFSLIIFSFSAFWIASGSVTWSMILSLANSFLAYWSRMVLSASSSWVFSCYSLISLERQKMTRSLHFIITLSSAESAESGLCC